MKNRYAIYRFIGAVGTALVVTVVSGAALFGKASFVEAIAIQALIVVAVFFATHHGVGSETKLFGRALLAPTLIRRVALWLLPALVFLLSWRVPIDIFFIYSIIWIACLPFFVSLRLCWLLLIAVNVAWYFVRAYWWNDINPLGGTLLISTFHVFALLSAQTAKESEESNAKTQELNRQLRATQHLLGEASRESERTRIARDLHDLLGHHLTALTINLQVAGHISDGEAKEKIDQCHALSKLLLNDVREAVSELRDMPVVNLKELIEIAITGTPRLTFSIDIQDNFELDDVNTAQVLLRIVQESITNTLKHSQADRAYISVNREEGSIFLSYRDNGSGVAHIIEGNGLTGMRERIDRLGGRLELSGKPSFSLRLNVPVQ